MIYHFHTILFPQAPGHSGGVAKIYGAEWSAEPEASLVLPCCEHPPLLGFCSGKHCLLFSNKNTFHFINKLSKNTQEFLHCLFSYSSH